MRGNEKLGIRNEKLRNPPAADDLKKRERLFGNLESYSKKGENQRCVRQVTGTS
jgi:hypothetical protein